jgi:hypothetical protein
MYKEQFVFFLKKIITAELDYYFNVLFENFE